MTRLNRTFVTALDREDIHALASRLDDVLDLIDAASTRMLRGAFDLLPRSCEPDRLRRVVCAAFEQRRARQEILAA